MVNDRLRIPCPQPVARSRCWERWKPSSLGSTGTV